MAAAEQRDVAIDDGIGGFEPELERPLDILVLLLLRDAGEGLDGLGAIGVGALHTMHGTARACLVLVVPALLSSSHFDVLALDDHDHSVQVRPGKRPIPSIDSIDEINADGTKRAEIVRPRNGIWRFNSPCQGRRFRRAAIGAQACRARADW